jgi:hypothetical protein
LKVPEGDRSRDAQGFQDLDRINPLHDFRQHRCLVTRTGAHFEHHVLRFGRKEIRRERHDIRL